MKHVLITVCGRAGSKGFRNKNLKTFCGKPLVYYTLSAAELFRRQRPDLAVDICLNTDSPELIDLVLRGYPEVAIIERPAELGLDTVPKMAVFQHSLHTMEERRGYEYDFHIDMDITSPLRRVQDLAAAVELFESEADLDLVMSAAPSRRNPYFNMAKEDEAGYAKRVIENRNTARQQAPACFDINASLYVFARRFLVSNLASDLWAGKVRLYKMLDTGILDIDCEEDYIMMELIADRLYATQPDYAGIRDNIR